MKLINLFKKIVLESFSKPFSSNVLKSSSFMAGFGTKTIRWNKNSLLVGLHNYCINNYPMTKTFVQKTVRILYQVPCEFVFVVVAFGLVLLATPGDFQLLVVVAPYILLEFLFKTNSTLLLRSQIFYFTSISYVNFTWLVLFQAILTSLFLGDVSLSQVLFGQSILFIIIGISTFLFINYKFFRGLIFGGFLFLIICFLNGIHPVFVVLECILVLLEFRPMLFVECLSPEETAQINNSLEQAIISYRQRRNDSFDIDEQVINPLYTNLPLEIKPHFFSFNSGMEIGDLLSRGPSIMGISVIPADGHLALSFKGVTYNFPSESAVVIERPSCQPYRCHLHPTVIPFVDNFVNFVVPHTDLRLYRVDESLDFLQDFDKLVNNSNFDIFGTYLINEYFLPVIQSETPAEICNAVDSIRPKLNAYEGMVTRSERRTVGDGVFAFDTIDQMLFELDKLAKANEGE